MVVGVRLTLGLEAPKLIDLLLLALLFYTRSAPIFILCGVALVFALHGWLTGALVEQGARKTIVLDQEKLSL